MTDTTDVAALVEELKSAATCGLPPVGAPAKRYETRLRAAIDRAATTLRAQADALVEAEKNYEALLELSNGIIDADGAPKTEREK